MINDCLHYRANMYDQEKRALSLSRLVRAANEFIFSNITDLIKSEVLFSWEPWHFWLLRRAKPDIKKAVDYTKNINLTK